MLLVLPDHHLLVVSLPQELEAGISALMPNFIENLLYTFVIARFKILGGELEFFRLLELSHLCPLASITATSFEVISTMRVV